MNKFLTVIIAILGAVDIVFSFVMPILVASLVLHTYQLDVFQEAIILIAAYFSGIYRASKNMITFLINKDNNKK